MNQPEPVSDERALEAVVQGVSYSNESSGFAVVRLRSEKKGSFTAVGPLGGLGPGSRVRLSGVWEEHSRYGRQLKVESFIEVLPSTREGIQSFLASGRIRGVGPALARRLVEAFDIETLDIMEYEPGRLLEIHGIGPKKLERIRESWAKNRGIQRIMVFLAGHGIPPGIATRLYRRYGDSALAVVRDNPYRLAEEVFGIGFLTADRIARRLGIAADAPERLSSGLVHALGRAASEGHLFLTEAELLEKGSELLDVRIEDLHGIIEGLARSGQIVIRPLPSREGNAVFSARFDRAEAAVAAGIHRLLEAGLPKHRRLDTSRELDWFERHAELSLASDQRRALVRAIDTTLTVITGGPGTGKTTMVQGLVRIFGHRGQSILLAAPTGRAAKRLEETSGHRAQTIHRLLEFNPVERLWGRNAEHPLEADCVVIDEVSMLDIELAARVLEAIPDGCRLVLVGDADQLPSVGPGDVLADVIASGRVEVVRLDRIFRQGEGSLIAENAHRINRGQPPVYGPTGDLSDFYFAVRDDPEDALTTAVDMAANRIARRFQLDPVSDIQLLTPMNRGSLGVGAFNERLQQMLAPTGGPEVRVGDACYRVGDKVMQLRNNYDLEVFNGDVGRISDIDSEERELHVDFAEKRVRYEAEDLEELALAYACTIHKAQGSEYPAVVVVLHDQHYVMLQRNLLYTAVTRGRRLVVVVGSRKALRRAIRTDRVRHRQTMLAERIRSRFVDGDPGGPALF